MKGNNFKFGALVEKEKAVVKELPLPEMKNDDVLIKQLVCNICTTDYQQWQGKREHQGYPMAGGHEAAGIIIDKGPNVSEEIKIGDQVSIIYDYCGECTECKKGKITNCKNIKQFGKNYSDTYYGIFGFANYFIRNSKSIVKVSNDVSASEAGFVEPLSSVIRGIKKLNLEKDDYVVIIGAGTMGLLNALVARTYSAKVVISERNPKKVKKAKELGFQVVDVNLHNPVEVIKESSVEGADVVIVAVGTTSANQQALDMIKPSEGKILFFAAGYPSPELNADSNFIHYKESEFIGTYGSSLNDFKDAADFISSKKIDVSPLIEETFYLENIQTAFKKASTRGSYRVSVKLHEEE
nr:alcohol dehydrogenase catalytic domain-containing protein [Mammaliicoccus lentus]